MRPKTARFRARWKAHQHKIDPRRLIFVDETTLTLDPPLRACWMKVGQQKRVPVNRSSEKQTRHIFGGYHWNTDTIIWTTARQKNTETFIVFLEELLLKQCPTDRVILVLDNVQYHKSAAALAALSLFEERVQVLWLPPYCPELNAIERFWGYLKTQACANHLEDHIDQVVASAERVMTRQNDPTAEDRYHVSKDF